MAWPESRLTTYTNVDPPKSNDLNAIQDAIIAGKHGDMEYGIAPIEFNASAPANVTPASDGSILTTGVVTMRAQIRVPVGAKLKTCNLRANGNGVVDITNFQVFVRNAPGGSVSLGQKTNGTDPATLNNIGASVETVLDVTDTTLIAGDLIIVEVAINAAGCTFDRFRYTISHP